MENNFFSDAAEDTQPFREIHTSIEILPDGKEAVIIGSPHGDAAFSHYQGDNSYGYTGTCGLCSVECVLKEFGVHANEDDVVRYAVDCGLCDVSEPRSEMDGGTTFEAIEKILDGCRIPSHCEIAESLEDVAADIEAGHGVIIGVNSGVLWNNANFYESGQPNHFVTITGVARDTADGNIIGFYINDSGNGKAADFIDADTMQVAFLEAGGGCVVTDVIR